MANHATPSDLGAPAAAAFAVPAGTSAEEIAAVTVLLLAASGSAAQENAALASAWGDPQRRLRTPVHPQRHGWWSSALPR